MRKKVNNKKQAPTNYLVHALLEGCTEPVILECNLKCIRYTSSILVKVASSGMSECPCDRRWRALSRVLYSLSLTSPSMTRYGSLGGTFFQNS
jgi:hypothetical protein